MDGKPRRPKNLAGYLEALSRPVFQAGMSRRVIDAKWDGIRDAFARFDPRAVADFGPNDIDRLLADTRIVRSRAKIEATIDNAQALLELDSEYDEFGRYLSSHGDFEATIVDLKRQFRYIGDTGAYHFLYPRRSTRAATRRMARLHAQAARSARSGGAHIAQARGDPRPLSSNASEMPVITRSQVIGRPIDEVFDAIVDGANFADWNPTIRASRQLDEGETREGTRFEWDLRGFGKVVQELQECERPAQVRIVPHIKKMEGGHRFRLTAQGATTRVDHELEMRPRGLFKLFAPMMGMIGRKNLRDTAAALQRHLGD